ncbi:SH3 domain-containing protein [Devosia lucknowensis]|uniref:SH3 domain-containing protein n=1 Tax=Devosia lucknowensis TaxID=1096929 RepID=UPI001FCD091B|nr:SH3 domain-containing protein [Devosia lucknowensis]
MPAFTGRVRAFFLCLLAGLTGLYAIPAAAQDNPSGLPLPRFVTTRSNPINVRVGPGTRYEIAWNYKVSGVPVEIIQEFDTWRKIRDIDGDEGWVHQSLLSGNRAGFAEPLMANGEVAIHSGKSADASVRARLSAGFRVSISECDGNWCNVSATQPGTHTSYSGWVSQSELWGVYPTEEFD